MYSVSARNMDQQQGKTRSSQEYVPSVEPASFKAATDELLALALNGDYFHRISAEASANRSSICKMDGGRKYPSRAPLLSTWDPISRAIVEVEKKQQARRKAPQGELLSRPATVRGDPVRTFYGQPLQEVCGFDATQLARREKRYWLHKDPSTPPAMEWPSNAKHNTFSTVDSSVGSTESSSLGYGMFTDGAWSSSSFGAGAVPNSPLDTVKRSFVPSHMRLERDGIVPPRREWSNGSKYQGDPTSSSFLATIPNLQNEYNCAVWITNIPATTPASYVFDRLRCGAVQALHLSPPNAQHNGKAAKLIFSKPEAAARLVSQAKQPGIFIDGTRLHIRYNRDGSLARDGPESRILLVDGPEHMMTLAFWEAYFDDACVYELDRWMFRPRAGLGRKTMEFRFLRRGGQCETCHQKIRWDQSLAGIVRAWYGRDVCDAVTHNAWVE